MDARPRASRTINPDQPHVRFELYDALAAFGSAVALLRAYDAGAGDYVTLEDTEFTVYDAEGWSAPSGTYGKAMYMRDAKRWEVLGLGTSAAVVRIEEAEPFELAELYTFEAKLLSVITHVAGGPPEEPPLDYTEGADVFLVFTRLQRPNELVTGRRYVARRIGTRTIQPEDEEQDPVTRPLYLAEVPHSTERGTLNGELAAGGEASVTLTFGGQIITARDFLLNTGQVLESGTRVICELMDDADGYHWWYASAASCGTDFPEEE